MELTKEAFHMNAGNGVTSYANNSDFQKVVISKTWSVLDENLEDMFTKSNNGFPKCMKIADLGCSSGPNTLFLVSHITDTIQDLCETNNVETLPEFEVFLNDLPDNDFNNLFKLVSKNEKKLECFMYGAPGSFYERLFPSNSLHFAYSSCSAIWLSQIPEGLQKNNKENVCIAMNSPPQVIEAYSNQFQRDFSKFLSLRAEEITSGGCMVLALIGRSGVDASSKDEYQHLTMLGETLADMVARGLVEEDDLYSFNVPFYMPCQQEVEAIISGEGSFDLGKMDAVRVPWDATYNDEMVFDKYKSAKRVAGKIRAVMEPKVALQFGSSVVDGVFDVYEKKMAEHLSRERPSHFIIVVSLTRKST